MSKSFKSIFLPINNEHGYTLAGVLLVFLIISILGVSVITMASNTLNISSSERDNQSAYYIAESGITLRMAELEEEIRDVYISVDEETDFYQQLNIMLTEEEREDGEDNNPRDYTDFEKVNGDVPVATVAVEEEDDGNYVVTSVGTIGNQERTLELPFNVQWVPKSNGGITLSHAVYIKNNLNINKGPGRCPSVIDGNIVALPGIVDTSGCIDERISVDEFPEFEFPTIPYSNEDLLISKNSEKVYDTSEEDIELVVNNLTVNGDLKVIGDGKLTIFINGELLLGNKGSGGTINKNGNYEQVDIFVKGKSGTPKEINYHNKGELYASLFAENDTLIFHNSHANHEGLVYTGGKVLLINGILRGTVIANELEYTGNNGEITFKEVTVENEAVPSEGEESIIPKPKKETMREKY